MKKLVIASLLAVAAGVAIEPEDNWNAEYTNIEYIDGESFGYYSLGCYIPIPVPQLGTGYRLKEGKYAIDMSININSVIVANAIEAHIKGFYYVNKTDYLGFGSVFGSSFGHARLYSDKLLSYMAPELCIGREYSDHFKEFNLRVPTFVSKNGSKKGRWFPVISFKYGWKY